MGQQAYELEMITGENEMKKDVDFHEEMFLEMDGVSQNESFARVVVASFLARANPTLEQVDDVKTAVSEAVTNAIVHGYAEKKGKVHIRATLTPKELTVSVQDFGVGIEDVAMAMEPFYTTVLDGSRSGMGFCMMEAFMDEVKLISQPGEGTCVFMRKNLCEEEEQDTEQK